MKGDLRDWFQKKKSDGKRYPRVLGAELPEEPTKTEVKSIKVPVQQEKWKWLYSNSPES